MAGQIEVTMQQKAMDNPKEALPAIGITTESPVHVVSKKFLSVYIEINGGKEDNEISRERVNAAVREWFSKRTIPEWVARACVLMQLDHLRVDP